MTEAHPDHPRGINTLVLLFVIVSVLALAAPWLPTGRFRAGEPISLASFEYAAPDSLLALFASGDGVGFLNFLFHGLTSGNATSAVAWCAW